MSKPAKIALRLTWFAALAWSAMFAGTVRADDPADDRRRMIDVLREAMDKEKSWVRIHAADAMIEHGHRSEVAKMFEPLADTTPAPERIGVWRVLAASAIDDKTRDGYVARVREVMLDPQATDRITAAETLGKLNAVKRDDRPAIATWMEGMSDSDVPMPQWLMILSADDDERPAEEAKLVALLSSDDSLARMRVAFVVGRLDNVEKATLDRVIEAARKEPADSQARMFLYGAAYLHDPIEREAWKKVLVEYVRNGTPVEQLLGSAMLGMRGTAEDLPVLAPLLAGSHGDTRIGAADGSLRLMRHQTHRMSAIDWGVIAGYLIAMLGVGVYYSRKTETRDEYLLGGRRMRPWAVGLSYFATIFSTITYMSWPGEMVKYGPMLLVQVLGFPLVVWIVGSFIIPYIMRLKVTSAYEILELRLGPSVRMLGSTFFLLMRLFWMAVILYTTSTQVLVPVAGLDPSHAAYVSALMGIVTVVYTSMGGFKAVVFTDVTQTLVLFGGALITIAAITWYLGGFGWIPTRWDPSWPEPVIGFDFKARTTVVSVLLSMLTWQICTASSDQMAIQRYLSTRDAAAAKRMFATAMGSNAAVYVLLMMLGMAVFAYFKARPEMMSAGQTLATHADQMFPQFVVFGVPEGLTGLIIAGLLAAAMSSLSSGLSSCSSVIAVDFIERLGVLPAADSKKARVARVISWAIGLTVVLLSGVVGMVEGNLLMVSFKVVNLLTAPLAGLFFMAMFVRWATPFGTWVGAIVGLVVIVPILYSERLGISFLWAMPFSLAAQMAAGMFASLAPIGTARPMLSTVGSGSH